MANQLADQLDGVALAPLDAARAAAAPCRRPRGRAGASRATAMSRKSSRPGPETRLIPRVRRQQRRRWRSRGRPGSRGSLASESADVGVGRQAQRPAHLRVARRRSSALSIAPMAALPCACRRPTGAPPQTSGAPGRGQLVDARRPRGSRRSAARAARAGVTGAVAPVIGTATRFAGTPARAASTSAWQVRSLHCQGRGRAAVEERQRPLAQRALAAAHGREHGEHRREAVLARRCR